MFCIKEYYAAFTAKDAIRIEGLSSADCWDSVDKGYYEIMGTYETEDEAYKEWKDYFSETIFEPDTSWSDPEVTVILYALFDEDIEGALDYSEGDLSADEIIKWFPELSK